MEQTAALATDAPRCEELTLLFKAVLQFTSDAPADAVVTAEGRDGAYIGSGGGRATGDRVRGTIAWSLYVGNCLYPLIRRGDTVPDDLHLCTLSPGGFIDTPEGARIRFEGRGYGLRSREWYRVSATLVFAIEAAPYAWLTHVLAVMEGELDERAGRPVCQIYVPPSGSG